MDEIEMPCPDDRDELHVKPPDLRLGDLVRLYEHVPLLGWRPRWAKVVRIELHGVPSRPVMITVLANTVDSDDGGHEMSEVYQPHQDVRVRRLKRRRSDD